MPKIKKGNRILNVADGRLKSYLKQGYDQINESGEVIQRATGGKNVSIGEYNRALTELKKLKETPFDTTELTEEISKLKEENKKLKTENTKFKKDLEEKKEK